MTVIEVKTAPAYAVRIGDGLLRSLGGELRSLLPEARRLALVTDVRVAELWAAPVEESLRGAGFSVCRLTVPTGDENKDGAHWMELLNGFAAAGLTRTDAVAALGGGMVSDLAGFAAATYLRGLPFVNVPTTLLAMADAAVGGKTGINLPAGKNLCGAFAQPAAVFCDTETLQTLPPEVFTEGCGELVKTAVLCGGELFNALNAKGPDFERERVIAACVAKKAALVAEDPTDRGARKQLNLGHTLAHAVEARSGYVIPHGLAVAMGLAHITRAAKAHGICEAAAAAGIEGLLRRFGLPTEAPCALAELLPFLLRDKKRRGERLDLILPEAIGRCRVEPVATEALEEFLKAGF